MAGPRLERSVLRVVGCVVGRGKVLENGKLRVSAERELDLYIQAGASIQGSLYDVDRIPNNNEGFCEREVVRRRKIWLR